MQGEELEMRAVSELERDDWVAAFSARIAAIKAAKAGK